MTITERAKKMKLPEPDMSHRKSLDDSNEELSYSAEALRAHGEQIASEADEVIATLDKALVKLMRWFPTDGDLMDARWPKVDVERAMTAYDEARAARASVSAVLTEARKQ